MSQYLLIESRDPFEDRSVEEDYALAASLARNGDGVALFLVQNGVLPARARARTERLTELAASGVRLMADSFSLRERAISSKELRDGVAPAEIDQVLDALEDGHKVVWL